MSWECRTDPLDGDLGRRWGHVVRTSGAVTTGDVCFLGFASDEGVRRNQGRVGAAAGPTALRKAMANLALREPLSLIDLDDIEVLNGDLEAARESYAARGRAAIEAGGFLMGLGGGHEIAYASYLALRLARPNDRIGIVYFDAHFDVREADQPTSGTPFRELITRDSNCRAFAVGINPAANTRRLFQTADELNIEYLLDSDISGQHASNLSNWLEPFDSVYVSFDLDVLPAHQSPGVSAPAALGVPYETLRPVLQKVIASGKVKVFDLAECNPSFDIDDRTVKLAARIAWDVTQWRV